MRQAAAPTQHPDFEGRGWNEISPDAIETCERALQGAEVYNPEVGAVYARALSKDEHQKRAVAAARRAADSGSAMAMNILALAYDHGTGVAKDKVQAIEWFTRSANAGFAIAQYNLAIAYENGDGVETDQDRALELYWDAAEGGHGSAQRKLGHIYRKGEIIDQDTTMAMHWYERANDNDLDPEALYWQARILEDGTGGYEKDLGKALHLYGLAARFGNKWAQHRAGSMYFHGKGTAPDREMAKSFFGKAAEQGHVEAMRKYGRLLHEDGDPVGAATWYRKAAANGDDVAKRLLAKLLGK